MTWWLWLLAEWLVAAALLTVALSCLLRRWGVHARDKPDDHVF